MEKLQKIMTVLIVIANIIMGGSLMLGFAEMNNLIAGGILFQFAAVFVLEFNSCE